MLLPFADWPEALVTRDGGHRCPWANIIQSPKDFIDAEYLPDYDTMDKEPSHLPISKVRKLLRFWLERQSSGKVVFRWKSILENGERVPAKAPKIKGKLTEAPKRKVGVRADGTSKKGKRSRRNSHRSRKQVTIQKDITSDDEIVSDDEHAPSKPSVPMRMVPNGRSKPNSKDGLEDSEPIAMKPKRSIKPRPIKKLKAISQNPDVESAGEEFNFDSADGFNFSDDEPVVQRAVKPPLQSRGLSPLWKAFNDQLPAEYASWSLDKLQMQFEVFRGWGESQGLFNSESNSGESLIDGELAPAAHIHRGLDGPSTAGDVANPQTGDTSSVARQGLDVIPSAGDVANRVFSLPENLGAQRESARVAVSHSGQVSVPMKEGPLPCPPAIPPTIALDMHLSKDAFSSGPVAVSYSKYTTPRFANLLNQFKQLSTSKLSDDNPRNGNSTSEPSPSIPRMTDVMQTARPNSAPMEPGQFVKEHLLSAITKIGHTSLPTAKPIIDIQESCNPILSPASILRNPYTPPVVHMPTAIASEISKVNADSLTSSSEGSRLPLLKTSRDKSPHPPATLPPMQTRKRKAEQEPFAVTKRVTKPPNKLPTTLTKDTDKPAKRGKKTNATSDNPPKRGRGRPKKST
jgi:hypothetical protein